MQINQQPTQTPARNQNKLYAGLIITGTVVFLLGLLGWFLAEGEPLGEWVYGMFGVASVIILLALVYAIKLSRQEAPQEVDYYAFFTIGITWTVFGMVLEMWPISILGMVSLIVGIKNKDKWRTEKWTDLSPQRRRNKIVAMIILGVIVLVGFGLYLLS